MKAILVFLLLPVLPAFAAPQDVDFKTLALRDGRYIEIVGDYQIVGEVLHFTMASGNERVTLPLAKVDLEKSERINKFGAAPLGKDGGSKSSASARDIVLILSDGSSLRTKGTYGLFGDSIQFTLPDGQVTTLPLSKVDMEATRTRNPGFRDTRHIKRNPANDQSTVGSEPESPFTTMPTTQEEFRENWDRVLQDIEKVGDSTPRNFYMGIGVILLLSLFICLSWGVKITLIYKSFSEGVGWGLSLLMLYLAKFVLAGVLILMVVNAHPAEPSAGLFIALLIAIPFSILAFAILMFIFIVTHCESRLTLLCLWWAPTLFYILIVFLVMFGEIGRLLGWYA